MTDTTKATMLGHAARNGLNIAAGAVAYNTIKHGLAAIFDTISVRFGGTPVATQILQLCDLQGDGVGDAIGFSAGYGVGSFALKSGLSKYPDLIGGRDGGLAVGFASALVSTLGVFMLSGGSQLPTYADLLATASSKLATTPQLAEPVAQICLQVVQNPSFAQMQQYGGRAFINFCAGLVSGAVMETLVEITQADKHIMKLLEKAAPSIQHVG